MNLFGRKPSRKFTVFIRQQETDLGLRITFARMEQHPIVHYQKDLLGTYELDEERGKLRVYINVELMKDNDFPFESKEITAAHEVLHVWAERAGFPTTKHPAKFPKDGPEAFVGGKLHSMIQHVAIDDRLCEYGFDPLVVQRKDGLDAIKRWASMDFTPIHKDSPQFVLETLNYMEGQLRYPREIQGDAKALLLCKRPGLVALGDEGLVCIYEAGCLQPAGALKALIEVRDLLDLKRQGVLVFDPRNGLIY
jgi:hypothetical protein